MTKTAKSILALCATLIALGSQCGASTLPALPEPVTNNAVAALEIDGNTHLYSFMGLGQGKTYQDVHHKGWELMIDAQGNASSWREIPSVPSSLPLKGRLASIAVGMKESVYLFGGYTVASDHTEISTPDVYQYLPKQQKYRRLASMPVPVDDAVALPYANRYIFLISGWHNDGNVNLTQVYDTQTNRWFQASPYLGRPVFGHAGGIVNNRMLICDGVKVVPREAQRRTFAAEAACYSGVINSEDVTKIDWRKIAHPTGVSRYRMASAGDPDNQRILFVGGSVNPYNYNGLGYNGEPSEPDNRVWAFDLNTNQWQLSPMPVATMDHRGLLRLGQQWITVGGMGAGQVVLDTVNTLTL